MTLENFTVAELIKQNPGSELELHLLAADYKTYEDFVYVINRCIDSVLVDISRDAQFFYKKSEDEISVSIIHVLKRYDLKAAHDEQIGGHCDIVIRGRHQYLWICEAKISRGNKYLMGGALQLLTRYLPGDHKSCCGAILIYCKNSNVPTIMSNWRQKLEDSEFTFSFTTCEENPLAFYTTHAHQDTGLDMVVRHIPLPLYFNPQDQKK